MTSPGQMTAGSGLDGVSERQLTLLRTGLRIMAARALRDDDLAEDVVQEVLLRALRAVRPEVAADPVRLGQYVGGIARHVIADALRARVRHAQEEPGAVDSGRNALDELVAAESMSLVEQGLRQLSDHDRDVLVASYYDDLSPAEIAERTRMPVVNVRKQKSRALQRLRAAIESRIRLARES